MHHSTAFVLLLGFGSNAAFRPSEAVTEQLFDGDPSRHWRLNYTLTRGSWIQTYCVLAIRLGIDPAERQALAVLDKLPQRTCARAPTRAAKASI